MKKRIIHLACAALLFGAVATANAPQAHASADTAYFCWMWSNSGWAGPGNYWGSCEWSGGKIISFTPIIPAD